MRRKSNSAKTKKPSDKTAIYVAIIGLVGTIIIALISVLDTRTQILLPVSLTQTANLHFFTSTSALASSATPTPIAVASPDSSFSFVEEFRTSLDGSRWEVNGPAARMLNDSIHMESTSIGFPFIYAKQNPFPAQGNFEMDLSFSYLNITGNGVGFAATNVIPSLGSEADRSKDILRIWQDDGQKLSVYFRGGLIYQSPGIDPLQHRIEFRYDGRYSVVLDGERIFISDTETERPSALWIGNPFQAAYPTNWTQLNIDYIRIYSTD